MRKLCSFALLLLIAVPVFSQEECLPLAPFEEIKWRLGRWLGPTGLLFSNQLARRGVRLMIIDGHAGPILSSTRIRRSSVAPSNPAPNSILRPRGSTTDKPQSPSLSNPAAHHLHGNQTSFSRSGVVFLACRRWRKAYGRAYSYRTIKSIGGIESRRENKELDEPVESRKEK